MRRLLPREEKFFDYFEKQTQMIQQAAQVLRGIIANGDPGPDAKKLEALEEDGDRLTRDIVQKLQASFITPLDAEDIHRLTSGFDSILDEIENVAHYMALYRLTAKHPEMLQIADLIVLSAEEISKARAALTLSQPTSEFFDKIAGYEAKADELADQMLVKLFEHENDIKALIKQKEIIQMLEITTDRFLIVADIIENVYIKNS